MDKLDLHLHSVYSDGSMTPAELVDESVKAGARLISLTDHDSIGGFEEMELCGKARGVSVLPGVELECVIGKDVEAHILAYNFDPRSKVLSDHLRLISQRRGERNGRILERLRSLKLEIEDALPRPGLDSIARTHMAHALITKGYAADMDSAFRAYLGRSGSAFFCHERPGAQELLAIIREMGGVGVLAHPYKLRMDAPNAVRILSGYGLFGIEAYYPSHTPNQAAALINLAKRYSLAISCGSDFHGTYRKGVDIACCFKDDERLGVWFEGV